MILIDSNTVIYGSQPGYQYLQDYLAAHTLAISKITLVEVLGYHALQSSEEVKLDQMLAICHQYDVSNPILRKAIHLRQRKKMSLGDSIIPATAQHHQLLLVSANESDFSGIPDLRLHNPIQ